MKQNEQIAKVFLGHFTFGYRVAQAVEIAFAGLILTFALHAEENTPGPEAECSRDLHVMFSLLLLKSTVSDGGRMPEQQRPGPTTGNQPLLISWQNS